MQILRVGGQYVTFYFKAKITLFQTNILQSQPPYKYKKIIVCKFQNCQIGIGILGVALFLNCSQILEEEKSI